MERRFALETSLHRLIALIPGLILLSVACKLFTPVSSSDSQSATLSPPLTFAQTATLTVLPVPVSLAPEPGYLLKEERLVDDYAIRWWTNPGSEIGFDDILLIEATGHPTIRVDMVFALHDLTGTDINADGFPDVVVETFSGGAHCCFGTQVYSLRDEAVLILQKPESNAGGYFEDLDTDGASEYLTYDDSFAYKYCPYAAGVSVKVIMAYDSAQDFYIPASLWYPEQYAAEIALNEQRASKYKSGELGEWDNSNICAILPLSLDYIYMGQPELARAEFYKRYSGANVDEVWNEVMLIVQGSPLFTP